MRLQALLSTVLFLAASCNQDKTSGNNKETSAKEPINTTGLEKKIQATVDSIRGFKPLKLSITEERSDVDELVPVGNNNHGSFAYILNENSGGASAIAFHIIPAYQDFSLQTRVQDGEPDTVFTKSKELFYYALKAADIKLNNSITKISLDSLQKKYGIRFEIKKTYGPPYSDDPSGKKTLAGVSIKYRQGETLYPSEIIDQHYIPADGVYDVYISDYLVLPGEEALFGFVVLVSEGLGFEGYIRKSIEIFSIGPLQSN